MKYLNQILIIAGTIALLIIILFFWMSITKSQFIADSKSFTEQYLIKITESWDMDDVKELTAPELLTKINTLEGQSFINSFKHLGKLNKVRDIEAINWSVGEDQDYAALKYTIYFEKTKVPGGIERVRINDTFMVYGFFLKNTEPASIKL